MRWVLKALAHHGLSWSPFGDHVRYLLQRHLTRSLPNSTEGYSRIAAEARRSLEAVARHWKGSLSQAAFYEFGAGWDLAGPIALYCLGVERQFICDVSRLAREELVDHVISSLERQPLRGLLARGPGPGLRGGESVESALSRRGISYLAPRDARETGLPEESVDCITSRFTLEHVPVDQLRPIFLECRRIMRREGIMLLSIDYQDHYSYADGRISRYNFLRFSDPAWALLNPPSHHQNRLRHKDYIALLREAGFDVLEEERHDPSADDLEAISRMRVADRFAGYSAEELGVRSSRLVLRKSAG